MKCIPYGRQMISKEDIEAVAKVLKSNWITQGPKIKEFENAFCKYTGAKYAVAISSGTAALHIACLAAGIKEKNEVITSPITFVASANCVLYCGGKPVFADIQEDTTNIDPEEIKNKITKRTKAVIPVHFAGHPCDMKQIKDIAKEHKLSIIEDACHALGAEYRGSKIGSCKYSDMTVFSFHPVKHITTGEGGMVLTNNRRIYERLLLFRNHGITKNKEKMEKFDGHWYYEMHELGFNYRITDFQCALGLSQLKKLDKFLEKRREIVNIYSQGLSGVDKIILPKERPYVKSSWHLYYLKLKRPKKRKAIFEKLKNLNIGVQVHYIPIYLQPYYNKLGFKEGLCPKAEDFYSRAISIPIYSALNEIQRKYIMNSIFKLFN